MRHCNQRGIVLTITLIFVIVMVIIAGISLVLMTNQARITEYQIKRIRAFYTAEAALTSALQQLRTGAITIGSSDVIVPPLSINGYQAKVVIEAARNGPKWTHKMTVTVIY